MKRLLLTHSKFSLQKILLAFSTLFLLLFSNANLNGQCSSGFPAAFPPSPALNTVCQGAAGVYFINGFVGGNTYTFTINGAAASYTPGSSNFLVNWTTPGNYTIVMTETHPLTGACPTRTYLVHVVPSAAPQLNCNDTVNVSLDQNCSALIRPTMVLEGTYDSLDYEVIIKDPVTGLVIPGSPTVTSAYKGRFLEVSAKHKCSTNSCWGVLRIEDKLAPMLVCRSYIVDCGTAVEPSTLAGRPGFPKPSPAAPNPVSIPGQPQKYTVNSTLWDNCGMVTLSYVDLVKHVPCPPAVTYLDTIFRTWTAVDMFGTSVNCQDTILVRAATIETIVFPPNFDGIDPDGAGPLSANPSPLRCEVPFAVDAAGNPHPSVTGYPSGATCRNINYSYTDIKLRACAQTYKILREWLIIDWCTGRTLDTVQIIKVTDDTPPLLTCYQNITVSTQSNSCTGVVDIPLPPFVSDCSPTSSITWTVFAIRSAPSCIPPAVIDRSLEDASGITRNVDGKSYHVTNLPVGCSWVRFYGKDPCGNESYCSTEIKVEEKVKPIAVCNLQTIVTLTGSGSAKIYANTFDDGSHDNCGLPANPFQVARMRAGACASPVISDTDFRDFVEFCCADVATNPNIVILRVFDKAGNFNDCMVEVRVVDKKPPVVVACPPNITVSCGFDRSNLKVFGDVRSTESARQSIIINDPANTTNTPQPKQWGYDGLITDDCNVVITELTPNLSGINTCGTGNIFRSWRAVDDAGNVVTCNQTITVVNHTPFTGAITWPVTYEGEGCSASVSPNITGSPTWAATNSCSNVVASYEDEVFNIVENVCFKIIRKWAVIDWCTYNSSTNSPIYRWQQVIKIKNTVPPSITSSCANRTVQSPTTDCNGYIDLVATATDDCPTTSPLSWTYTIDLDMNGTIDYNGTTNDASGTYPHGTHKITWVVKDNCGNQDDCSYLFTIKDGKKPTPVCRSGLVIVVMPSTGEVTIWASDYNAGSYDNCTPQNALVYSFSPSPSVTSRTFRCADIPNGKSYTFPITIYVTDSDGNQDFCVTEITLQDGAGNICPDRIVGGGGTSGLAMVAGSLANETNSMVQDAMITISGKMTGLPKNYMTNNDGKYAFIELPKNESYFIEASKNDDPLNGVTTNDIVLIQKHILGIQTLTSPYKIIAADVNNSQAITAKDISDIRKVILGVTNEFPNKKSWKFVNADQKFNDILYPWPVQENVSINDLDQDLMQNNFVAVKIGDVSGNAKTNQFSSSSTRSNEKLNVSVEDKKYTADEFVTIPFTIANQATLTGLQLELTWNKDEMTFEDLISNELSLQEDQFSTINLADGKLSISWDNAKGTSVKSQLFTLKMKALKSGNVSNSISINESRIAAEAYDNSGKTLSIRLNNVGTNGENVGVFYLYQNTPNPFSENTTISFTLPKDEKAVLSIFDVNGKILKVWNQVFKEGLNTIEITKSELVQSGILYYSLETGGNKSVRKMILID